MHANQFLSFIVSIVNCSAIHVYQIVSYVSLLTIKLIDFLFFFSTFFQQYFVCDYAINVECNTAETFYSLNDNFGEVPISDSDVELTEK